VRLRNVCWYRALRGRLLRPDIAVATGADGADIRIARSDSCAHHCRATTAQWSASDVHGGARRRRGVATASGPPSRCAGILAGGADRPSRVHRPGLRDPVSGLSICVGGPVPEAGVDAARARRTRVWCVLDCRTTADAGCGPPSTLGHPAAPGSVDGDGLALPRESGDGGTLRRSSRFAASRLWFAPPTPLGRGPTVRFDEGGARPRL